MLPCQVPPNKFPTNDPLLRPPGWRATYLLSRVLYAFPEHVEDMDGQPLQVGSEVLLHPEACTMTRPCMSFELENDPDLTHSLTVTAICPCGECIELKHTFAWPHDEFGKLDDCNEMRMRSCPADHEYKCSHMGHSGECQTSDGEWKWVHPACGACFEDCECFTEADYGIAANLGF